MKREDTYAAIVYIQCPFEFKPLDELSPSCEETENKCERVPGLFVPASRRCAHAWAWTVLLMQRTFPLHLLATTHAKKGQWTHRPVTSLSFI